MPETVRLLPDAELHEVLRSTLQRVNRACNEARTAALDQGITGGADLRTVVKASAERFKLPAGLVTPVRERVQESLTGPPGRRQKFGEYQSLTLAASSVKWPASDRVALPTGAGKRTVRVYVDPARGNLRPPLEGRPVALVFRNGEFELVAAGE
jgi:hypothetical protein